MRPSQRPIIQQQEHKRQCHRHRFAHQSHYEEHNGKEIEDQGWGIGLLNTEYRILDTRHWMADAALCFSSCLCSLCVLCVCVFPTLDSGLWTLDFALHVPRVGPDRQQEEKS